MANLKRYSCKYQGGGLYMMVECEKGEYVKFADIKEIAPSASPNTGSLQSLKLTFLGGYIAGSRVGAAHPDIAFNEWLERQQASA
jgi:hypothetical protein